MKASNISQRARRAAQPAARAKRTNHHTPRLTATRDAVPAFSPLPLARVPAKWREQYRTLLRLREQRLSDATHLIRDAKERPLAERSDFGDVATDHSERDLHLSLLSAEENNLQELEAALRRIEAGTYGVCEMSGRSIPRARLRAVPWTRFTTESEQTLERRRAEAAGQSPGLLPLSQTPPAAKNNHRKVPPPAKR